MWANKSCTRVRDMFFEPLRPFISVQATFRQAAMKEALRLKYELEMKLNYYITNEMTLLHFLQSKKERQWLMSYVQNK